MRRYTSMADLAGDPSLRVFQAKDYKRGAWAYVTRVGNPNCGDLIIGTRKQKGDEKRDSQLVLPGGIENSSDSTPGHNAIRKAGEEAGVTTAAFIGQVKPPYTFLRIGKVMVGAVLSSGEFIMYYRDSGRAYEFTLFHLETDDEPSEVKGSGLLGPHFATLSDATRELQRFTPACALALDVLRRDKPEVASPNDIIIEGLDPQEVREYLVNP